MSGILLIDTNTTPFNQAFPVYPIGLDYLQGAVEQAGLGRPGILDLSRLAGSQGPTDPAGLAVRSLGLISEALSSRTWDAVCLSLRNIDSTYPIQEGDDPSLHYYAPQLTDYLDLVQKNTGGDTQIILGGTGFSLMPDAFLRGRPANWRGVIGPAEDELPALLASLTSGNTPPRLVKAGQTQSPGSLQNRGLLSAYLDLPRGEGTFGLRTKAGCGQACGYCPYPLINGGGQNLKPVNGVLAELRLLTEVHRRHPSDPGLSFMFADDIFNRPLPHAKAILKKMLGRELVPASWHAYLDPGNIDAEFMKLILATNGWSYSDGRGGRTMFFPLDIESGSDRMLAALGKPFRSDQILAAADNYRSLAGRILAKGGLSAAGLGVHLLVGYPGEDKESIAETCGLINRMAPEQIAIQMGVRVYPGTPLAKATSGKLWQRLEDLHRPVFAQVDEERVLGWMREHLDPEYDRLARRGKMLLIGRGGERRAA